MLYVTSSLCLVTKSLLSLLGRGKGAWKSWLPSPIQRCTFENLLSPARTLAKAYKSGPQMPSMLRHACAAIGFEAQQAALFKTEPAPDWIIMNHLFDETRCNVYVQDEPVSQYPVLNQHAVLKCKRNGQVDQQELFVPSAFLYSNSGSCMYGAMTKYVNLLLFLQMATACASYVVTADAFPANLMFFLHVASLVPPKVLCLYVRCLHHQIGLALSATSRRLQCVTPAFCLVKVLQSGSAFKDLLDEAKSILFEEPNFRDTENNQDPQDDLYAKAVLEATSYQHHDRHEDDDAVTRRRKNGRRLRVMLTSNWKGKRLRHHCKRTSLLCR